MADTVKQMGVRQLDNTYEVKDIGVDYQNVDGLATQATAFKATSADKATADKNNKDITTYIASIDKNGENLVVEDGAGTSTNVDLEMTGATSSADGEAGFVPKPLQTDVDKYLKGDGTWGSPDNTTYQNSANISIDSNNVIDLTDTTVTSGTYGPTADVTGTNGSTIVVPAVTVDAKGRVTRVERRTYTSVDTQYTNPSGNNTIVINNTNKTLSLGSHNSTSSTYGVGDASRYGHLKISDTYKSAIAGSGIAASQKAVSDVYDDFNGLCFEEVLQARSTTIIIDSFNKDGYFASDLSDMSVKIFVDKEGVHYSDLQVSLDPFDPSQPQDGEGHLKITFSPQGTDMNVFVRLTKLPIS